MTPLKRQRKGMVEGMSLFTKIFLCGVLVFGLAFSVSGYFLLHYSMESSMAREAEFALKQYQYDKFAVQSAFLNYSEVEITILATDFPGLEREKDFVIWETFPNVSYGLGKSIGPEAQGAGKRGYLERDSQLGKQAEGLFGLLAEEIAVPVAFFAQDGTLLYSEIEGVDAAFLGELSENTHVYRFRSRDQIDSVLVGSALAYGKDLVYFVTQWDMSKAVSQQETLQQYFLKSYVIAMGLGMVLLGSLALLVTGPLKRVSGAAYRIARGEYGERLTTKRKDEIGELAQSFNQMADAVEEKIEALSRAARAREDFVANFAHELKTPLTSIIGYADMIYQRELSREAVRDASWYIWNEGMRLEALSLKLMDLTVLGRQDFPLQEMAGDQLLKDVAEGLSPFFQEKGIDLALQAEAAYIRADYDLLKTLLINLMDNSVKAGCGRIEISGRVTEAGYRIAVADDGCGMEQEELSRITEAFYMVDKARSRQQHGAGLGLALSERIAGVHGAELVFRSRKGEGTEVSICLQCGNGEEEDGDEEED